MKTKSKVPLYQINLDIRSTGGDVKNNDSSILDHCSKSSSHGVQDDDKKRQQPIYANYTGDSRIKQSESGAPLNSLEIQSSYMLDPMTDRKDQDTDPKHGINRSD